MTTCGHTVDTSSTVITPDGAVSCATCARRAWAAKWGAPTPRDRYDSPARVVAALGGEQ